MNMTEIFVVLSNETRLNILKWLKDPEKYFPPQGDKLPNDVDLKGGICVGSIQDKAAISQSTVSNYLSMMQRVGLLQAERHGKWTYYRRNEDTIRKLAEYIKNDL